MIFQNYPLFYVFLFSALICGFTAYHAWKRRTVRSAKTFSILMALITWWVFFYVFELVIARPDLCFLFLSIEYLAIPWIPGFLIWFSLEFGGYEKYCTREGLLVIFIIPAIIFIGFFTNGIFHLFYDSYTYIVYEGLVVPSFTPGILYRLMNFDIILAEIFCFLIILKVYLKSPRIFKPQMAMLVVCMILMFVSLVLFFLVARPYPNFDPQPVFLAIMNVCILAGIFRFQFFDLISIPYHSIFENLEEGIIVLDDQNRIIQINRKAAELLETRPDAVMGENFDSLGPFLASYHEMITADSSTSIRAENRIENGEVSLLIDMYPVFDNAGRLKTRMVIFRDITEITRKSQALRKAGEKLSLLNSITRHDILNQVAIISGYGAIMALGMEDKDASLNRLERISNAADSVRELIQFTSAYQDLGISQPVWLNVPDLVSRAWNTLHPPDGISLLVETDLVVFADMLLEKVFFNLMDNSLRHGTAVTGIRISSSRVENGYVLAYEDNGCGVEPDLKEKIFTRGFGRNTGYGLFLVREILSITSIEIHETGTYGSGVRFEMSIPLHGVKTE
jgi:PAS domain S-box-containing protein